MHAISSYRGNRPTNTHTPHTHIHQQTHPQNKQTHRQDRLQYTAPLNLARNVMMQNAKQTDRIQIINLCSSTDENNEFNA